MRMTVPRLDIHLVRHGESEWNALGRLQGQTVDVPLSALGWRHARKAADLLAGCGARSVVSSDQLRAVQTAQVIAERMRVPVRMDAAWREQGLGVLEGLSRMDAWARVRGERWSADWRPPEGESTREVYRRLDDFFSKLATQATGGELVVVTHGDTLRTALGLLDGAPPEAIPWMMPANGAVISRRLARTADGAWRVAC